MKPADLVDVVGLREAFHEADGGVWQTMAEAAARPALERLQTISDLVNGYVMPPEGRGLVETVADLAAGETVVVRSLRVPDLARTGSGQPPREPVREPGGEPVAFPARPAELLMLTEDDVRASMGLPGLPRLP